MGENKIELDGITKEFKTKNGKIVALQNVSFKVKEGDLIALVGPSGCGKSTVIRMIDGIISPTKGSIKIDDDRYTGEPDKTVLKKIGFVFQNPNLLPWLTVRDNLKVPLKVMGLQGNEWEKRVDELLRMVGLEKAANLYPREISEGMKQRLGVIRAMVHDPEILLMDEPFGALDELTRETLDLEILKIWGQTKKTIIFITHNIAEAILIASQVYVMGTNPGRIMKEIEIELPYPREHSCMETEYFANLETELMGLIDNVGLDKIK